MIPFDQTRDRNLKSDFFTKEAGRFFAALNIPMFKNKEQAGDFIETFDVAVDASWKYSDTQERWVVSRKTLKWDNVEFNVFSKLKKRIDNGMDDSIGYYFDMNKKIVSGELAI